MTADQDAVLTDRSLRRQLADAVWDPADPAELASSPWGIRGGGARRLAQGVMPCHGHREADPDNRPPLRLRFEDGLTARQIATASACLPSSMSTDD